LLLLGPSRQGVLVMLDDLFEDIDSLRGAVAR
jgi:hypothetical protein